MPRRYVPFRGIRSARDLLLAQEKISRPGTVVELPTNAYYAEICAWVNLRGTPEALLAEREQTLLSALVDGGECWRLTLSPYGYLRFAGSDDDEELELVSSVPIHCLADPTGGIRLGLSVTNYAWQIRDTPYTHEARAYSRVRLLVGRGSTGPLQPVRTTIGDGVPVLLRPVPGRMVVGENLQEELRISQFAAYNTGRDELFASRGKSAKSVVPIISGGGGFEPRWVDEETIEVFTRPEFTQTSSYWTFLNLRDCSGRLRRLRLQTIHHGGDAMSPTFFASTDRQSWERIVPARVELGRPGETFRAEFRLTPEIANGGYIASGPAFGEKERGDLLAWAPKQLHTTVAQIGESVEGRPIHAIRVGAGKDGPGLPGVVIVCGQHSPLEIMAGRLIQPVIEGLLDSPRLAERCNFYFVPTINVDCAHHGGNGLNANMRNTNRHWFDELQPETRAVINYFDGLHAAGQRIDFALDLHAGGVFKNHVLMSMGATDVHTPSPEDRRREAHWQSLLARHAGVREEDGWPLGQVKLRASDYFHQVHGATAFCLEMSSCSYFDPGEGRSRPFDMRAFDVLATGLVEAIEEWLAG